MNRKQTWWCDFAEQHILDHDGNIIGKTFNLITSVKNEKTVDVFVKVDANHLCVAFCLYLSQWSFIYVDFILSCRNL